MVRPGQEVLAVATLVRGSCCKDTNRLFLLSHLHLQLQLLIFSMWISEVKRPEVSPTRNQGPEAVGPLAFKSLKIFLSNLVFSC